MKKKFYYSSIILNFYEITPINTFNINFTFETFYYVIFILEHVQLILANNYKYNFRDKYNKTKNNETKLLININEGVDENFINLKININFFRI